MVAVVVFSVGVWFCLPPVLVDWLCCGVVSCSDDGGYCTVVSGVVLVLVPTNARVERERSCGDGVLFVVVLMVELGLFLEV